MMHPWKEVSTASQRPGRARIASFATVFILMCAAPLIPSRSLAAGENVGQGPDDGRLATSKRPDFKKRKLKIAGKTVTVEIADTDERREYGLMFQTKLPRDEGMLFVFDDEAPRSFWMHNTLIPLSIAYMSREKVLNEFHDMQPAVMGAARPKTYPSRRDAMFALEMNVGWFARNKIRPGVSFQFADKDSR